jgi:hypothetical protein
MTEVSAVFRHGRLHRLMETDVTVVFINPDLRRNDRFVKPSHPRKGCYIRLKISVASHGTEDARDFLCVRIRFGVMRRHHLHDALKVFYGEE